MGEPQASVDSNQRPKDGGVDDEEDDDGEEVVGSEGREIEEAVGLKAEAERPGSCVVHEYSRERAPEVRATRGR